MTENTSVVFESKVDTWIAVLLLATALICMLALLPLLSGGISVALLSAVLLLPGAVLPVWLLLATRYRITDRMLTIESGPLRWRIALDAIVRMEATRSLLAGPALSLDRLRLVVADRHPILISPRDKRGLQQAIEARRESSVEPSST